MEFDIKTDYLTEFGSGVRNMMDARITETPVKVYQFKQTFKVGITEDTTIEIARVPHGSKIIGLHLDSDFKDITYSIGVSTKKSTTLVEKSIKSTISKVYSPIEVGGSSIYITIDEGIIKAGKYITGFVQFI